MPINMIDIASMAPRSQEASQLQNNIQRHAENTVANAGNQFAEQVEHDTQQTVRATKDEMNDYKYGQGNSGGGQGRNNKKKKDEKKDEAPMAPRSNSSFDIMI